MAESEKELKSLLMKVKEESEKVGLNSTFRKLRSWHPLPSLHGKQMGEQWEQWLILFFWAPKSLQMVIAAMKLRDAYSLEEKLRPTQTVYSKAETTLPTKVCLVKVFPVVMYGCESWITKKAEH